MKKNVKNALVIVLALALVIVVGKYSADHRLKATDGEENVVTEVTETVTEATEQVEEIVIESAPVEISTEELVTEEATEAVTEATTEEVTEEATEETTSEIIFDDPVRHVEITCNIEDGADVIEGAKATLTANITGFDDVNYSIQWQNSMDGENWNDVAGANSEKYTFTITNENVQYLWRVLVDVEK